MVDGHESGLGSVAKSEIVQFLTPIVATPRIETILSYLQGLELIRSCFAPVQPFDLPAKTKPRSGKPQFAPAEPWFAVEAKGITLIRQFTADQTQATTLPNSLRAMLGVEAKDEVASVFRRRGEMWVLTYGGATVFMKDSVGLIYIARLLSEPKRDIAAVSLLAARAGIDPRIAAGSSGPILDEEARAEYGHLYREQQDSLADAEANNDLGRIEKLQGEMDALMTELARATGLGGRNREQTDAHNGAS